MRLARLLASALSPGGSRAALSILIFHRVLPHPDPLFPDLPDAARFERELSWLRQTFDVLPLDQALASLQAGTLPARAAAITFDDGYADNATVALPALRRHGLAATFFIATGFLDGGRMWNDTVIEAVRRSPRQALDLEGLGLGRHDLRAPDARRRAIDALLPALKYRAPEDRARLVAEAAAACRAGPLPDDLMMTRAQVAALRDAGMTIGAHTQTHPILCRLPDDAAWREISGSKQRLEAILGEAVTWFAYPNGRPGDDYGSEHVEMVRKAGFHAAVTTSPGVSRAGADPYQLPRFTPWDRTPMRYGLRLVDNLRREGMVAA